MYEAIGLASPGKGRPASQLAWKDFEVVQCVHKAAYNLEYLKQEHLD